MVAGTPHEETAGPGGYVPGRPRTPGEERQKPNERIRQTGPDAERQGSRGLSGGTPRAKALPQRGAAAPTGDCVMPEQHGMPPLRGKEQARKH